MDDRVDGKWRKKKERERDGPQARSVCSGWWLLISRVSLFLFSFFCFCFDSNRTIVPWPALLYPCLFLKRSSSSFICFYFFVVVLVVVVVFSLLLFFMTRDLSVDRRLDGIPFGRDQTQQDKSVPSFFLSTLKNKKRKGGEIEEKKKTNSIVPYRTEQKRLVQDHCADWPSLTHSLPIFLHSLYLSLHLSLSVSLESESRDWITKWQVGHVC